MTNKNLHAKYIQKLKDYCVQEGKCWIWKGATKTINGHLYGYFNNILVHQLMWSLSKPYSSEDQSNTEEYFVNHKCKNRLCINPKHLYLEKETNTRKIKRIEKSILGERFYDPSNWEPPNNPEANPSKFAEWIFSCEVGKTQSPPIIIRDKFKERGKKDHIKLEDILRKKWFDEGYLERNEKWELFYCDVQIPEKSFKATKLLLNNQALRCKPDVVLHDKSNNQFIIIERKFTYVPLSKIYIPKWSSAQGQLWCYSWIDDFIDAKNVILILELYQPLVDKYILPLDRIFEWKRNDQIHHNKCLKMFERYGGIFKE